MKNILIATAITTLAVFAFGGQLQAQEKAGTKLKLPFFKLFKNPKKAAECDDCPEPPAKVVKTKTLELRREAFTKWEEHCCGIKMQGNYIKVTYETFYSDGTSVVWDKEYRS